MPASWLPPLVPLASFDGDATKYLECLFGDFKKDFIDAKPSFQGRPVSIHTHLVGKYPSTFDHLTSQSDSSGERSALDLRRCERLCWLRAIIDNSYDPDILIWENQRGKDTRTLLFLEKENFLVVLQSSRNQQFFFLITAYYIEYENRKNRLLAEYENYQKSKGRP